MFSKLKSKFADWIYFHTSFPTHCKSGNELNWMFKDNCPACLAYPIEALSNAEYHRKYPAKNSVVIGTVRIYLCDIHMRDLYDGLREYYENDSKT